MNIEEKLAIITRNTEDIVTVEELRKLLETKEQPSVYLGNAITGKPHIGYFTWAKKISDFLAAGFKVKILLADVHGALDNCPWDLLEKRYEYYKIVITGMLTSAGADITHLEFVKGSDFQLNKDYLLDMLKLSTFTTIRNATKAASDVVKMGDNPKLSGLIYPLMQALDEQYLGVDVQYGGVDQRKIMMFARENLSKVGYKPRIELMTPLIPGLTASGKMSASDSNSKIDLLDDLKVIQKKLNKAHSVEKEVEGNGLLAFCKYVLMTIKEDKGKEFVITRPEKFGGNISFKNYEELESAYASGALHPMDLKQGLAVEINLLLEPVREAIKGHETLVEEAYPNN
jgi:tyrosyl-tRNA synthetase